MTAYIITLTSLSLLIILVSLFVLFKQKDVVIKVSIDKIKQSKSPNEMRTFVANNKELLSDEDVIFILRRARVYELLGY